MKEFKGTPGPWVSCGSIYQDYGYHVKNADKDTICMGINEASNANLIAAAPDLLSALQNIFNYHFGKTATAPAYLEAKAAIAKALGESK